ncbi:DNA polymerase epsilon subunit C [Candida viswanathii]|uniref:DNA polymerase epsilon subunit C n=1 Tax=Candida viswanathii TaxID=5486 RepID=A0A367Y5E2_9ASCO|nr:DNA polymerase epsilon subunit C [Candida viswanathii]
MSQPESVEKPTEVSEPPSQSIASSTEHSAAPAEPPTSTPQPNDQQQQQQQQQQPAKTKPINDKDKDKDNDAEESQNLTLPISKIKRIFKMDPDYAGASASAVYTAGLATELFVQYFAEQASLLAKMEKRKKIQYKDFANAVSAHDALNFLGDTIPKTHPIGELVQLKKVHVKPSATAKAVKPAGSGAAGDVADGSAAGAGGVPVGARPKDVLPKGQQTLNFPIAGSSAVKKPEGITLKNSILDLVTRDDDADKDVVMKD